MAYSSIEILSHSTLTMYLFVTLYKVAQVGSGHWTHPRCVCSIYWRGNLYMV
ncbi:MAG: hypothetical protein HWN65_23610 [Candidatus Helarchaeota archaeon]|nr:hypothetical protein [Candidatus Helarchaeota archaeon]